MRFVSLASAWGVRLVAVGLVLALVAVYLVLPHMQFENGILLASVGKTIFLAGVFCLWFAAIVSDIISGLKPKNAG